MKVPAVGAGMTARAKPENGLKAGKEADREGRNDQPDQPEDGLERR